MVDIHSHFLPAIDDGAKNLEESLAMLALARQHGTRVLVASPHADTQYRYHPETVERLLAELRALTGPGLELVRGCEFHLTWDNLEDALAHPARYTIGGHNYLLMELSDLRIFPNTSEQWDSLERAGMSIILAHPERNPLIRDRFELIEEWAGAGRYMQVTGSSLLGHSGPQARDFACRMLDRGLVHFIASDGHDLRGRPPRLDLAFEWLARHYGPELAGLLCVDHPLRAVEGRPLDLSAFPPARPGFWRRLFSRS
jgi:protein-tyrosine phosphatase